MIKKILIRFGIVIIAIVGVILIAAATRPADSRVAQRDVAASPAAVRASQSSQVRGLESVHETGSQREGTFSDGIGRRRRVQLGRKQ
jgi:hypothetical protein